MFKKFSLTMALALTATGLSAQAKPTGSLSGMTTSLGDIATSSPKITFGCEADGFGTFDMCIDNFIQTAAPKLDVLMAANISPRAAVKNRRIIMRYYFVYLGEQSPYGYVKIYTDRNTVYGSAKLNKNQHHMVYRISDDGGDTWKTIGHFIDIR